MNFVCSNCGILEKDEYKIICPTCGEETVKIEKENGRFKYACSTCGEIDPSRVVIRCLKCELGEVRVEVEREKP